MTTKCTGLMGRVFGHKWIRLDAISAWKLGMPFMRACSRMSIKDLNILLDGSRSVCQRCGAVTGEKK